MHLYLDLLRYVMENGMERRDRTGTGTISVFGYQMRFPLQDGFPICTTKRVWFRGLACELLWFLSGSTNIKPLVDQGISIWTAWPLKNYLQHRNLHVPSSDSEEWAKCLEDFENLIRNERGFADAWGDLGPVYGKQWRSFCDVDQITSVIDSIRENPWSRRHIVSAWNPKELDLMALPPCHMFFQFSVIADRLSCHLYIRSNDLFLGAPFNIAQYALLTHLIAHQTGLQPGDLIYTIGDAHIYLNHLGQVTEQLKREPYPLPELQILRKPATLFDYSYDDFNLIKYRYHPAIKAPVAV
ncbi:MAG: thymidylate synthase [Bacteroidetes bacterium]|nr:thymidylate synthase [Bacteroidota bacterium]MCY4205220.1 thymidylate synthase [Bacteroidota bacterium]